MVYVLSRQYEQISGVPWNKTAINAKVGKFTTGEAAGDEEWLGDFGKYGDGEGELIWPTGICLDSGGNVYVTDEWLNRVSIFDPDGSFLGLWGTPGGGDGELTVRQASPWTHTMASTSWTPKTTASRNSPGKGALCPVGQLRQRRRRA